MKVSCYEQVQAESEALFNCLFFFVIVAGELARLDMLHQSILHKCVKQVSTVLGGFVALSFPPTPAWCAQYFLFVWG